MRYTIKLNGTFDLEDTRNFEAYLQNFLFRNNLGFVEREMTKVCYEDEETSNENRTNKIPTHSIIEIDAPDRERVLDDFEYLGSETEVGNLIQNEKGLPVFEVIIGS